MTPEEIEKIKAIEKENQEDLRELRDWYGDWDKLKIIINQLEVDDAEAAWVKQIQTNFNKEEHFENNKANAEFIVTAVNHHDELVEALESIRKISGTHGGFIKIWGIADDLLKKLKP